MGSGTTDTRTGSAANTSHVRSPTMDRDIELARLSEQPEETCTLDTGDDDDGHFRLYGINSLDSAAGRREGWLGPRRPDRVVTERGFIRRVGPQMELPWIRRNRPGDMIWDGR